jgi:hypothetical protein
LNELFCPLFYSVVDKNAVFDLIPSAFTGGTDISTRIIGSSILVVIYRI